MLVCLSMRVLGRERESEAVTEIVCRQYVCVCMCVWMSEREREIVCV